MARHSICANAFAVALFVLLLAQSLIAALAPESLPLAQPIAAPPPRCGTRSACCSCSPALCCS